MCVVAELYGYGHVYVERKCICGKIHMNGGNLKPCSLSFRRYEGERNLHSYISLMHVEPKHHTFKYSIIITIHLELDTNHANTNANNTYSLIHRLMEI